MLIEYNTEIIFFLFIVCDVFTDAVLYVRRFRQL
jgi:hypothetical protein